jgi:hypothetical protein
MGAKFSRLIQWGREETSGTAVPATAIVRATGVFDDDDVHNRHVEDVNQINGTDDQYIARKGGQITIDFDPANFEQMVHVLDCSIAKATAAADGAGSGWIRTYAFPTSSTALPDSMTIEMGDSAGDEEMEFSFCQRWTLEGSPGNQFTLSSDWYGRQQAPTTRTADLTIPTVSPLLFGNAKLYIDDVDSVSYTPFLCSVLGLRLEVDSGVVAKFGANGALTFCGLVRTGFIPRLTMTIEHNAAALAEKADWRANIPRRVKLLLEGAALGVSGTGYSKKSLIFESMGFFEDVTAMADQDGNNVVDFVFQGAYNRSEEKFGSLIHVCELETLTGY